MRPPAAQSALQSQYRPALYRTWGRVGLSAIAPAGRRDDTDSNRAGLGRLQPVPHRQRLRQDGRQRGHGLDASRRQRRAPTESDLAFARNAASDVLTKGDKDSSQPWENPETGARGSVTPLAQAYSSDGRTCRDFLASYVNGTSESWLQGAACQSGHGRWEIHTLKPWQAGLSRLIPVAKMPRRPQMKPKGGQPEIQDLTFPEGDVTDARPL